MFECGICTLDKPETRTGCVTITGDDKVCIDCFHESVVPGFKAAIDDPSQFPYYWGSTALRFQDYRSHIGKEDWEVLIAGYRDKETELELPKGERLYCHDHGCFVGPRSRGDGGIEREQCPAAAHVVCTRCGRGTLSVAQVARLGHDPHICRRHSALAAYQDKKRGRDYQVSVTPSDHLPASAY